MYVDNVLYNCVNIMFYTSITSPVYTVLISVFWLLWRASVTPSIIVINEWYFKEKCKITSKFLFTSVMTLSIPLPGIFHPRYTVRALKSGIPHTACWCTPYYEYGVYWNHFTILLWRHEMPMADQVSQDMSTNTLFYAKILTYTTQTLLWL